MSTTATIPDLWPTDFSVGTEPSPATILRQQGYILGERTKDVVYGEVDSSFQDAKQFSHWFSLNAPFCKIRQEVILVRHGLIGYPADLALINSRGDHIKSGKAVDSKQFIEILRDILASPYITQLVGSLIAQAREIDDE